MSAEQRWNVVNDENRVYVFGGFKKQGIFPEQTRCLVFKRSPLLEPLLGDEKIPDLVHRSGLLIEENNNINEERKEKLKSLGKISKKSSSSPLEVYHALIGVFVVWRFPCLVVVKDRKLIGVHFGEYIFEVKKVNLIPLFDESELTKRESKKYLQYKKYFKQHIKRVHLYYSYLANIVQSTRSLVNRKIKGDYGEKNVCSSKKKLNIDDFLIDKLSLDSYNELIMNKYTYNSRILENIIHEVKDKTSFVLVTCGAIIQRYINTSGNLNVLSIIMRKSRYYVGPRFRKRGISPGADVGNDVETEVIVYRPYPMHPDGYYSSYLLYRGSVPGIWTQHAAIIQATPPFIIPEDRFQDNFTLSVTHLRNLVKSYDNLIVLSLLKSGVKNKENSLAILLDKCVRHYNVQTDMKLMSNLCSNGTMTEYDEIRKQNSGNYEDKIFGKHHISEVVHLDVSNIKRSESRAEYDLTLRTILAHIASLNGYTSFKLDRKNGTILQSIQQSVTRVNCVDCLDRTNDAQMILTVSNISSMLFANGNEKMQDKLFSIPEGIKYYITGPEWVYEPVVNGVLPQKIKEDISSAFKKCGDTISCEYCGSQAHDKSANAKKGKAVILNLQRHIDSNFTAKDEQIAADVFHGLFEINFLTHIDVWDIDDSNERLLHLHGSDETNKIIETMRRNKNVALEKQRYGESSPVINLKNDKVSSQGSSNIDDREPNMAEELHEVTMQNIPRDYSEFLRPGGKYTLFDKHNNPSNSQQQFSELEQFSTPTDKKQKSKSQSRSNSTINGSNNYCQYRNNVPKDDTTTDKEVSNSNSNNNNGSSILELSSNRDQIRELQGNSSHITPNEPRGVKISNQQAGTSYPLIEALMSNNKSGISQLKDEYSVQITSTSAPMGYDGNRAQGHMENGGQRDLIDYQSVTQPSNSIMNSGYRGDTEMGGTAQYPQTETLGGYRTNSTNGNGYSGGSNFQSIDFISF